MNNSDHVGALIKLALDEDIGSGDITTSSLVSNKVTGSAKVIAREPMVLCGQSIARQICEFVDKDLTYGECCPDGTQLVANDVIAEITGKFASILSVERTLLNFMQRLSGISTKTYRLATKLGSCGISLLDTRKTTPGWRCLEKYAVKVGGGKNHRMGLWDAVLIKNNHLDVLGMTPDVAVNICRQKVSSNVLVEVEVRTLAELKQALSAAPDVIMLDNMSPELVTSALSVIREQKGDSIKVEVSGGLDEDGIDRWLIPGIDYISVGGLTHSVEASDISLRHVYGSTQS